MWINWLRRQVNALILQITALVNTISALALHRAKWITGTALITETSALAIAEIIGQYNSVVELEDTYAVTATANAGACTISCTGLYNTKAGTNYLKLSGCNNPDDNGVFHIINVVYDLDLLTMTFTITSLNGDTPVGFGGSNTGIATLVTLSRCISVAESTNLTAGDTFQIIGSDLCDGVYSFESETEYLDEGITKFFVKTTETIPESHGVYGAMYTISTINDLVITNPFNSSIVSVEIWDLSTELYIPSLKDAAVINTGTITIPKTAIVAAGLMADNVIGYTIEFRPIYQPKNVSGTITIDRGAKLCDIKQYNSSTVANDAFLSNNNPGVLTESQDVSVAFVVEPGLPVAIQTPIGAPLTLSLIGFPTVDGIYENVVYRGASYNEELMQTTYSWTVPGQNFPTESGYQLQFSYLTDVFLPQIELQGGLYNKSTPQGMVDIVDSANNDGSYNIYSEENLSGNVWQITLDRYLNNDASQPGDFYSFRGPIVIPNPFNSFFVEIKFWNAETGGVEVNSQLNYGLIVTAETITISADGIYNSGLPIGSSIHYSIISHK